jgi:multisubunit Na+/H+ antiporter MnhE subunit
MMLMFALILSIIGVLFCLWLLITLPRPVTFGKCVAGLIVACVWIYFFGLVFGDFRIAHIHPTTNTTITVMK